MSSVSTSNGAFPREKRLGHVLLLYHPRQVMKDQPIYIYIIITFQIMLDNNESVISLYLYVGMQM